MISRETCVQAAKHGFILIARILTSSRTKSFLWRLAMMALAIATGLLADKNNILHLSPEELVIAGLILGELSKAVNNVRQGQPTGLMAQW